MKGWRHAVYALLGTHHHNIHNSNNQRLQSPDYHVMLRNHVQMKKPASLRFCTIIND
jgi:hypothetical protein